MCLIDLQDSKLILVFIYVADHVMFAIYCIQLSILGSMNDWLSFI